jgi:hypothetical protein
MMREVAEAYRDVQAKYSAPPSIRQRLVDFVSSR